MRDKKMNHDNQKSFITNYLKEKLGMEFYKRMFRIIGDYDTNDNPSVTYAYKKFDNGDVAFLTYTYISYGCTAIHSGYTAFLYMHEKKDLRKISDGGQFKNFEQGEQFINQGDF
jgi:hypothetical protein